MKVGPIVCLKTKEIIYINENRYFCRELKDDSLRKKFRSLAQKLREIILKQKVAILSGTPVISLKFLVKTSKHSFSRKKSRLLTLDDRKRLKTWSKKGRPIKKTIAFLKERNLGYLPMHLSQFRIF